MGKMNKKPIYLIGKYEYCEELDTKFFISRSGKGFETFYTKEKAEEALKEAQKEDKNYIVKEHEYSEKLEIYIPKNE